MRLRAASRAFGYVGRCREQAGTAGTSCRWEGYVEGYRKREDGVK